MAVNYTYSDIDDNESISVFIGQKEVMRMVRNLYWELYPVINHAIIENQLISIDSCKDDLIERINLNYYSIKKDEDKLKISKRKEKKGIGLYDLFIVTTLFATSIFIANELRLSSAIKADAIIIANEINSLEQGQPSGVLSQLKIKSSIISPVKKYYLVSVQVNGENYYVMKNDNVDLCVDLKVRHKIDAKYKVLENGKSVLDFKKILDECENTEMIKLTPSRQIIISK